MDVLRCGVSVDIARSNGRIHAAIVTEISKSRRTAQVEWTEGDDEQGKEISFADLVELNPQYQVSVIRDWTDRKPLLPSVLSGNVNRRESRRDASIIEKPIARRSLSATPGRTKPYASGSNPNSSAEFPREHLDDFNENVPPMPSRQVSKAAQANRRSASHHRVSHISDPNRLTTVVGSLVWKDNEKKGRRTGNNLAKGSLEFIEMIWDYRNSLPDEHLAQYVPAEHQICVAVRKRPMNKKELQMKDIDVITVSNHNVVAVHEPKNKVDLTRYLENHTFRFDQAFDESADNDLVYKYTARPLVDVMFEGGIATCFAYGQTGSGKTHTMGGEFARDVQEAVKGIYSLAAEDVFKLLKSRKYKNTSFKVVVSFFEIYSGKVCDLLDKRAERRVLEDGNSKVQIVDLVEKPVSSVRDVQLLIQAGSKLRTSGKTSANANSSRSHAILQFQIKTVRGRKETVHGKFSLIDLAGNERGADTSSADRQTRAEGAEINQSLLALKECIRALSRNAAHLPFRSSTLTRVLKDSFSSKALTKTCMIAMISPGMTSCENTLNTLRYADRVKELGAESPDLEVQRLQESDDSLSILSSLESPKQLSLQSVDEQSDDSFTAEDCAKQEMKQYHLQFAKQLPVWLDEHEKLLNHTTDFNCDIDAYAEGLERMLEEQMNVISQFRGQATTFRAFLARKN